MRSIVVPLTLAEWTFSIAMVPRLYIRDIFSLEECQSYIEQAEAFGIKSCGYKHSIRITDRMAAKSQLVANQLFQRLVPFLLEPNINLEASINEWPTGICRTFPRRKWYPVGLNEVFRICRYEPGGFFNLITMEDMTKAIPSIVPCIKTFMVYLNENFIGGPTRFYNEKQ
jgi:hypothetical protein